MSKRSNHNNKFNQVDINKHRRYLIIKNNRLIQETHFHLPLSEQKILLNLFSQIPPNSDSLRVSFSTQEYAELMGLKSRSAYEKIKYRLLDIANHNFWIRLPNGQERIWFWFKNVYADPKRNGMFNITFRDSLRPYLLHQHNFFTKYRFADIQGMGNKYSPMLYELFVSNYSRQTNHKGLDYSLDELRTKLELYKKHRDGKPYKRKGHLIYRYPRFSNFNYRIIRPALRDINTYSSYNVKAKAIRYGHATKGLNVRITKKTSAQQKQAQIALFDKLHRVKLTPRDVKEHTLTYKEYLKFKEIHDNYKQNGKPKHKTQQKFYGFKLPKNFKDSVNKRMPLRIIKYKLREYRTALHQNHYRMSSRRLTDDQRSMLKAMVRYMVTAIHSGAYNHELEQQQLSLFRKVKGHDHKYKD